MARLIKSQHSSCRLNAVAVSWAQPWTVGPLPARPQFLFPRSGFFPSSIIQVSRAFAGNPNGVVAYPPYLMGQYCGCAVAQLVAPTPAGYRMTLRRVAAF